ncbi:MAG: hemolysin D [Spirochaetes bacterium GWD1_61_31]|nr:MAG: hemolysin D [Spirochaetes bacterium GWB1_60_80]OHD41424.1 MAG: hemolysin D [Spirochaetes bacterium GWD1_61_31]OHD45208.1 MAG: hemolysin D [Spirochaetes bacterium GWE1_60_18]OHD60772.1 MAG: hemolysin D [Spirochaetes bacterium GWF1_60_12]
MFEPRQGRPAAAPAGRGQEVANAATHGLSALLAVAATTILVGTAIRQATVWHVVSVSLFGASAVFLYLMSTLYHALPASRLKRVFKLLDHSAIYVLIAGTYTPFCLTVLRPTVGWWLFGLIWGIALAGLVSKPFLVGKLRFVSTLVYVVMGWIIVLAWKPLSAAAAPETLRALVAGGVLYTVGAGFYLIKNAAWSHPVWHCFVTAGTALHFLATLSLL